ncbi:unnamed protein product, partial [Rotaria socialis]
MYTNVVKPLTGYGQLGDFDKDTRFVRCDSGPLEICDNFLELIVDGVGANPDLLISCFGGAANFAMTDKLEKEFMNGISQAAATK